MPDILYIDSGQDIDRLFRQAFQKGTGQKLIRDVVKLNLTTSRTKFSQNTRYFHQMYTIPPDAFSPSSPCS